MCPSRSGDIKRWSETDLEGSELTGRVALRVQAGGERINGGKRINEMKDS